ncbi:uncharacterized protein LOC123663930 [Melitaea cinxia]|uniref:uncharacterized protein LOC123663930 n=1 Tax=Melitaea cinxia TaxID=113334 RepID=UPI001E270B69|nr:uncharacterized protein LOC123663930 [Melitaea cinxia]
MERKNVEHVVEPTETDVFRIGVKPPPFWAEEPTVWFSQLEGNFTLSGIKDDDTKFYYVISTLEQRYAAEVKDIIVSPPKTGKYELLKSELIKRLSASREKEVKQLLIHEELGDRRPSNLLRHTRLAGPSIPDDFTKTIWISRLPIALQPIIAAQKTLDLQSLADLADSLHEIVPRTPQVASTSTSQSVLESMAKQIDELSMQVNALNTYSYTRRSGPRRHRSQTRHTSSTRSQSNHQKFPVCWYHYTFGKNANKCIKPCDFKSENCKGSR